LSLVVWRVVTILPLILPWPHDTSVRTYSLLLSLTAVISIFFFPFYFCVLGSIDSKMGRRRRKSLRREKTATISWPTKRNDQRREEKSMAHGRHNMKSIADQKWPNKHKRKEKPIFAPARDKPGEIVGAGVCYVR
jgi:hypothetical protein